jgi:adenylate kinase family enzyme
VRRVHVVGNSGSGKSTLAAALAQRLGATHIELDAIYHQADWVALAEPEFVRRVTAAVAADVWVADGNYQAVRPVVWARADTVVWLDFPRRVAATRIVRRTVGRAVNRRELWNGNRESWAAMLSRDPERSVILWSLTHHRVYRERYAALLAPGARPPGLEVVRLTSSAEARRFLAGIAAGGPGLRPS